VEDVVEVVCRLVDRAPQGDHHRQNGTGTAAPAAPLRVVNIGSNRPVGLEDFIATIESAVGRKAMRRDLRGQLLANDRTGTPRAVGGVIWRKGVEDMLPRIEAPTLVLSGEEDVAVTPARSRRTAEAIRSARFQTIPRAGHSSSLENPEAVTAALRQFFAEVRGRNSRANAS